MIMRRIEEEGGGGDEKERTHLGQAGRESDGASLAKEELRGAGGVQEIDHHGHTEQELQRFAVHLHRRARGH